MLRNISNMQNSCTAKKKTMTDCSFPGLQY